MTINLIRRVHAAEAYGQSRSLWRDLNSRPIDYESIALPLSYTGVAVSSILKGRVDKGNSDAKSVKDLLWFRFPLLSYTGTD